MDYEPENHLDFIPLRWEVLNIYMFNINKWIENSLSFSYENVQ